MPMRTSAHPWCLSRQSRGDSLLAVGQAVCLCIAAAYGDRPLLPRFARLRRPAGWRSVSAAVDGPSRAGVPARLRASGSRYRTRLVWPVLPGRAAGLCSRTARPGHSRVLGCGPCCAGWRSEIARREGRGQIAAARAAAWAHDRRTRSPAAARLRRVRPAPRGDRRSSGHSRATLVSPNACMSARMSRGFCRTPCVSPSSRPAESSDRLAATRAAGSIAKPRSSTAKPATALSNASSDATHGAL